LARALEGARLDHLFHGFDHLAAFALAYAVLGIRQSEYE
jgi:hypothetical protein